MREFDEIDVKKTKASAKKSLEVLGKKLKDLRIKNKLTLNDVSFFVYSNISTIERLELGKLDNITLLTLTKISVFYDIPLSTLFNETSEL